MDFSIPSIQHIAYTPRSDSDSDQAFSLQTGCPEDYACFAIWHGARPLEDAILEDLDQHFEVIADFEVFWSEVHYNRNIARLYERPGGLHPFGQWDEKIGPTPFRFVVVRDRSPKYTWQRSVSGAIEPSNEAVVAAKYRHRALFDKPYQVHSSNNLSEFLLQSALVLGPGLLQEVLGATSCRRGDLTRDLEGADGWPDWSTLFAFLNISVNYLVLRNFESLPERLGDADIDVLCDNFQRFASAANVAQSPRQLFKGELLVAGEKVRTDIRFVGDGYYPAVWQKSMLERKVQERMFFVPAPDDLFFSLLYHCKIQKSEVKPKYREELAGLARELRFDWFTPEVLDDDFAAGRMLGGYLRAQKLQYEVPVDRGVHANVSVIKMLPRLADDTSPRFSVHRLQQLARQALREPRKILPFVRRNLYRYF